MYIEGESSRREMISAKTTGRNQEVPDMAKVIHVEEWQDRVLLWRREHLRESLEDLMRDNNVIEVKAIKFCRNLTLFGLSDTRRYGSLCQSGQLPRGTPPTNEE